MKILDGYEHLCLFCGEEINVQYDEYTTFYECNCKDAVLDRKITEEINKLKLKRPDKKFCIENKTILIEIEK